MNRLLRLGAPAMAAIALAFLAAAIPQKHSLRRDRIETPRGLVKQPSDFFQRQRAFPFHQIPNGAYAKAVRQARQLDGGERATRSSWEQAGPTNVGGRVTAIAVHPTTPSVLWIGAAAGGILKSTNSGTNWTALTDDFGSLSIGALAIHPTDPNILLAGTGEANASGDSYDGIGILKTTNGGTTWTVSGLEDSQRIGRIAFDPTNPNRIHVAVAGSLFTKGANRGMYRSTDGGTSWQQTLLVSDSTSAIDVVVHPTDSNIVYAAFWERLRTPENRQVGGATSRIWKSTNGGDSWSVLSTGLPAPGPTVGRIGLAIAKSLPTTIYAAYADDPGFFAGLYRSTNSGTNWARMDDGFDLSDVYSSFGWYFGNVRVSPRMRTRCSWWVSIWRARRTAARVGPSSPRINTSTFTSWPSSPGHPASSIRETMAACFRRQTPADRGPRSPTFRSRSSTPLPWIPNSRSASMAARRTIRHRAL
ncbi:MAG TPA: hypothetical protein VFR10_12085 [bacterium]|nr:hypothetical protein [bacterium]